jgi:nitroreductase
MESNFNVTRFEETNIRDFAENFANLIKSRRSTKPRFFNGKTIDDGIVWQILESATWAPTNCLTQPWRFKVFTGNGLSKLAEFQANLYKKLTPEAKFSRDKYERMLSNVLKSSHVIVICMKRNEEEIIPEIEEVEAVACGVQNMLLTATVYQVCSFWGSGGVTYTEELKEFLGLGAKDLCLGYLYLGYSDRPANSSRRDPVVDKVEWVE